MPTPTKNALQFVFLLLLICFPEICDSEKPVQGFKICIRHIHNYTEYNQQWNVDDLEEPS